LNKAATRFSVWNQSLGFNFLQSAMCFTGIMFYLSKTAGVGVGLNIFLYFLHEILEVKPTFQKHSTGNKVRSCNTNKSVKFFKQ
jgi:hypothetical protein